jgi:hypothetical protein
VWRVDTWTRRRTHCTPRPPARVPLVLGLLDEGELLTLAALQIRRRFAAGGPRAIRGGGEKASAKQILFGG